MPEALLCAQAFVLRDLCVQEVPPETTPDVRNLPQSDPYPKISISMRDYLQSLYDDSCVNEPWKPVSRPELAAWLVFYLWFMVYAFRAHGGFLFIDCANLVVHEGGHNLFAWFGQTLCLWGGTILQWTVPLLLAVYFFTQRQTTGFVFSAFFFFENWLYTATYMADARAMELPLVTTGDPEFAEHDFHAIFTNLGVLDHDTQIAAVVRTIGWLGMIAVVAWLASRASASEVKIALPSLPLRPAPAAVRPQPAPAAPRAPIRSVP